MFTSLSTLKLYLQLGMKVTKFHIVLKFKKSHWLEPCICCNTKEKRKVGNSFKKTPPSSWITAYMVKQ